VKHDLLNGGFRVVDGPPEVRELAWEWIRMKEAEVAQVSKNKALIESAPAQAASSTEAKPVELLTLRPSFYGIGVDLKELGGGCGGGSGAKAPLATKAANRGDADPATSEVRRELERLLNIGGRAAYDHLETVARNIGQEIPTRQGGAGYAIERLLRYPMRDVSRAPDELCK
jgi:hypothetical protein